MCKKLNNVQERRIMEEVLKYVSVDLYRQESSNLKNGQTKIIYQDTDRKIKLKKSGKRVFNIIVNYGTEPITDIAKSLLVQA